MPFPPQCSIATYTVRACAMHNQLMKNITEKSLNSVKHSTTSWGHITSYLGLCAACRPQDGRVLSRYNP